ncbi:glycerophosphodiester phosphodiesterase family protein [Enterovibrio sp. 27052020O]|uniref:glycerophosphodiester phosphodiesterase family protein n=1 Tax=Enterovibrio sp. 27052020O TaxID=3241166 RepID=UPI0038911594
MNNIIRLGVLFSIFAAGGVMAASGVTLGPRPAYLVADMDEGALKEKLSSCLNKTPKTTAFSIGHRGASLQFPEHTKESYVAAAQMGAGIIECDVTFTKDKQLVCRHSQNDLHTTTDVLTHPDLAEKCTIPFTPANPETGEKATAECRTSDFTLAEFKRLKGKMDGANPMATTPEEYMKGTADFRTDLYASRGTLMTHAESIALLKELGVKMTPELKEAKVAMPYDGFTQQDYAQKMVDEYKAAGVKASDVYPQSFNMEDVKHWVANEPEFGQQAVYLDSRMYDDESWKPSLKDMAALKDRGVEYIAPPLYALVTVDNKGNIVPSDYAKHAKAAGLGIITWTLERSGHLGNGGGWYYQSVKDVINNDGDVMTLLDVLAQDVGVVGVFSDWPATTTFYANCMNP